MAERKVVVCDECGELGKPVFTYRVSGPRGSGSAVLCADDAWPLTKWIKPRAKPRQRDLVASHLTTMEEIEAQKAQKNPRSQES